MVSAHKWPQGKGYMAISLALIAGYVDAYGFIQFGTFVSFMSGNTTEAGSNVGSGLAAAAFPSVIAIVSFVAGVFTATLIVGRRAVRARIILYALITLLLSITIALHYTDHLPAAMFILTLSFTMGIMNTALSRVGSQPVSVTFVTGTLSQIGGHLARACRGDRPGDSEGAHDTHFARAKLLAMVWLGFFVGALLAGALTPRLGVWMLSIPAAAIFLLMLAETLHVYEE